MTCFDPPTHLTWPDLLVLPCEEHTSNLQLTHGVATSWKHGTILYIIIKSQERPYNNNIFIKIIIIKNLINNNNNNIFMWPTVYFAHLRSKKHLQNASNKKKMFFTCPTAIGLALSTFKAKQALINIIKVLITKVYACYLFILYIYIYIIG